MKITIEFKPDCSLQDKLEALDHLKYLLNLFPAKPTNQTERTRKHVYNGYSIQIIE